MLRNLGILLSAMNNQTNASYGQSLMRTLLTQQVDAQFVENYRPEWLDGMELDFYFEAIRMAIEFQGGQHFTPCFGWGAMNAQRNRDTRKKAICKGRGIRLIRIEATDLNLSRFRCMLNQRGFAHVLKHPRFAKGFNRLGTAYRVMLKEKFNCPTAHRRGTKPRKEAFVSAFGCSPLGN